MITLRPSKERGHADHGWLKSYHTFSFADYMDPKHMGFRSLRVINEDWVEQGQGFGEHPHRDMEIITYVIEGALEHKDSMGTGSVIHPGEIQIMSAGTGITHSEFNHSKKETVHLLQMWVVPAQRGIKPRYEERQIKKQSGKLVLLASKDAREGTPIIYQDVDLYVGYFAKGDSVDHKIKDRYDWLQVVKGSLSVNNTVLKAGDGAGIEKEETITIEALEPAEFLLFDLG